MVTPKEPIKASLPAWRIELNERVRAIKAKRSGSTIEAGDDDNQTIQEANATSLKTSQPSDPRRKLRNAYSPEGSAFDADRADSKRREETHRDAESAPAASSPTRPEGKSGNPIIEAALIRVQRATETANRASLPRIEPTRPFQQNSRPPISVDKEATARALEPAPSPGLKPNPAVDPLPRAPDDMRAQPARSKATARKPDAAKITSPARAENSLAENLRAESSFAVSDEYSSEDLMATDSATVLEEIEPLDYLEAEIRKVDRAFNDEFARDESPSLIAHAIIGAVDLISIAVSCAPFVALIAISDGDVASKTTLSTLGLIALLVALLYLALTQSLCGKTFGMMLTNTCVVDARTHKQPSIQRILLRTAGWLVATAFAFIGLIWAAFNRKRRGWHDFISGTLVVRDF